jgi:hypothetical protein
LPAVRDIPACLRVPGNVYYGNNTHNVTHDSNTCMHKMQAIGIDHSLAQDKTLQDMDAGCDPFRTLLVLAATCWLQHTDTALA